jgi:hypothetical protein
MPKRKEMLVRNKLASPSAKSVEPEKVETENKVFSLPKTGVRAILAVAQNRNRKRRTENTKLKISRENSLMNT